MRANGLERPEPEGRPAEVTFDLAPIRGRPGMGVLPLVVLVGVAAVLAGTAWLTRTSADDRPPSPGRGTAPRPTAAAPVRTPNVIPLPRAEALVLTSPSHDGAPVSGPELRVVGYVLAGLATVSIAVDDGTVLRELGAVVPAPKPGDPAADRRSWFSASIPLEPARAGPLWLQVQAFAPTGEPVATVRRAIDPRPGPRALAADSPVLGGSRPDRERGTDGLMGGIVFRRQLAGAVHDPSP